MKNIIIIIATILISFNSYSQNKNTNNMQLDLKVVNIDNNNFKYYSFNSKNNTIQLFNMDNTLWKTISLIIPENAFLDEIIDISSDKLNDDSDIEVVYTTFFESYSDMFENPESLVYENYDLIVVNETGKELLKVKDGRNITVINDAIKGKIALIGTCNNNSISHEHATYAYSGFSF